MKPDPTERRPLLSERNERIISNFLGWSSFVPATYIFFTALIETLTIFSSKLEALRYLWPDVDFPLSVASIATGISVTVIGEWKKPQLARSPKVRYWLQTVIRYFLASTFLSYGFAKIFGNQFYTWSSTLDTPLGEVTGIQLAWRFFGYSYSYTLFVAFSQIVPAFLLFFRRTTTLAALILLPVISNIVIINFTHDIPVKLYSSIYLIMVLYLLWLDHSRLIPLFGFNYTSARVAVPFSKQKLLLSLKVLIIVFLSAQTIGENYYYYVMDKRVTQPLQGVWAVEDFQLEDGSLQTEVDHPVWRKVYFESDNFISIRTDKPRASVFGSTIDAKQHTIQLTNLRTGEKFLEGSYKMQSDDRLLIEGLEDKHPIRVTMKRVK